MAALHLDPELAELDPVPAHDLATGPRTFARDVDPDIELDEAALAGRQDNIANRRIVAPHNPAIGIAPGAEHDQGRIHDGLDLGRDRILGRRALAPLAESHPTSRTVRVIRVIPVDRLVARLAHCRWHEIV